MISAWWLLLIVPAAMTFGLFIGGFFGLGSRADADDSAYRKGLHDAYSAYRKSLRDASHN